MPSYFARCAVLLLLILPVSAEAQDAPGIYSEKCASCHGAMRSFVKRKVSLADTTPVLDKSGVVLATFLTRHGRLRPEEIDILCRWIAKELESTRKD